MVRAMNRSAGSPFVLVPACAKIVKHTLFRFATLFTQHGSNV